MTIADFISQGIGPSGDVPHFITMGLDIGIPEAPADEIGSGVFIVRLGARGAFVVRQGAYGTFMVKAVGTGAFTVKAR